YRGHAGKAALFSAMRNVALDPPSILLMASGAYTIQEFICKRCETYLGWKFVRAHDGPERWKEGFFVLELDFVEEQAQEQAADDAAAAAAMVEAVGSAQARRVAHGLHRRTMSAADFRRPTTPKGVAHGVRNSQAAAARPQTQMLAPRRGDADEYDGGPFWQPR
ncbi:hypothetical protein LXA43DRAFT_892938, partial [Ganoderma leucocontextum]